MSALSDLHREIDARVDTIRASHPDWLCGKGCDGCCRQLAELPRLTHGEWQLLQTGLAALDETQRDDIQQRLTALGPAPTRPVTCPLLDPATGACPVYAHRPVACRTYGFYAERDRLLVCQQIAAQDTEGKLATVVWGNHAHIDRTLTATGEIRSLAEWFNQAEWKAEAGCG